MKTFKETSKNIKTLSEGLFDLEGQGLKDVVEKDLVEDFLKKCKGNYNAVFFKDGSVRVNGKLIITGIDSNKIYFNCKDFHGKLIIENCPKLETLEGSFLEKLAVFDGSITINQCPSLTSLKGIPEMIKGDLSITNCKKLKSIDGVSAVFGNLYWSGNGKKYSEEDIKNKTHVIKKIFCAGEEMVADVVEGLVNEALNNPWLQRLAAQFKKYPFKEYSWRDDSEMKVNKLDDLFKQSRLSLKGRVYDKITSDEIDVYDMGDEKDKKELAKVFWNAYSGNVGNVADLILVYNEDTAEFIYALGCVGRNRGDQNVGVARIPLPHKDSYQKEIGSGTLISKTDAKAGLLKLGTGFTVIVINDSDKSSGADERSNIHKSRLYSQEGVITPGDVDQYKKIASDNINRYKKMIAQAKLEHKKSDDNEGYDKLIDQYEQINTRIIKLVRNVAKDPKKYSKYDVTSFLNWVRDEQRYNPKYKSWVKNSGPQYYGESGLMCRFRTFMDAYLNCFGSSYSGDVQPDESDYKRLEGASKILKDGYVIADKKLKEFGV